MTNTTLFKTGAASGLPMTDARNAEGAPAYALTAKAALAQFVGTGCFRGTFYATAETQLKAVQMLVAEVEAGFVARCAVYARESGRMKDMPVFLLASLVTNAATEARKIAPRILSNGKSLRTFVQMIRSGVLGRKSLGSFPKRLVLEALTRFSDEDVFKASVGKTPSLADVIKMVHPAPATESRRALYGYLLGKSYDAEKLPSIVREFEDWRSGKRYLPTRLPFEMTAPACKTTDDWIELAKTASWQTTRMNLNTFARHGVFESKDMVDLLAARIASKDEIGKAHAMPYQLLAARRAAGPWSNATEATTNSIRSLWSRIFGSRSVEPDPPKEADRTTVPTKILDALERATEIAVENVRPFRGNVVVCPDVSGSMDASLTGTQKGSTSAVRCVDVAAMIAVTLNRIQKGTTIMPFDTKVHDFSIAPSAPILETADRLAKFGGGGTACSEPIKAIIKRRIPADLVIVVSDNESWCDARGRGTALLEMWNRLKKSRPNAKLACIDLTPHGTVQAMDRGDILNIGGFTDAVFDIVRDFAEEKLEPSHFCDVIERTELT